MSRESKLAGTALHIRLGLRRDRVRIMAWSVTLAVLVVGIASSWDRLYPTAESRRELAATLALSPSLTAILGPLFNPISTGGLTAWRSVAGYVLVLGLVQSFAVVRHTRADEQSGLAELTGSGSVGSAARASAAFVVALTYGLAFGVFTSLALAGLGLSVGGSIAFTGAIVGASGVFTGVAVIAAQAAHSSRGANGISGAVVALAFAISAIANSSTDSPLIWLSPFGWAEQVRSFADERWWLVALSAGVAMSLAGVGVLISSQRDLGSSLIPARLGRAQAGSYLSTPIGLAWRIDRTWLMWWMVGAAFLGIVEGSILYSSLAALSSNPALKKLIEQLGGSSNLAAAFIVLMIGIFALAASGFAIATIGRLVQAEASGQAELELSAPLTRTRWAVGHVLMAYLGAALIVIIGSAGIGLVYGSSIHDIPTSVGHALGAGLITIPAVWLVAGAASLSLGYRPGWFFLGWVVLGWCVIAGWFGAVLGLPDWLLKTSPFGHLPTWPGAPMSWPPVVVLALLSAALLLAAARGLLRRNIPA
jgi:ABC-2 type transport system permease protein